MLNALLTSNSLRIYAYVCVYFMCVCCWGLGEGGGGGAGGPCNFYGHFNHPKNK